MGLINIGKIQCKLDCLETSRRISRRASRDKEQEGDHKQCGYMGPNLGMVLMNHKREVVSIWVADIDEDSPVSSMKL